MLNSLQLPTTRQLFNRLGLLNQLSRNLETRMGEVTYLPNVACIQTCFGELKVGEMPAFTSAGDGSANVVTHSRTRFCGPPQSSDARAHTRTTHCAMTSSCLIRRSRSMARSRRRPTRSCTSRDRSYKYLRSFILKFEFIQRSAHESA